MTNQRVLDRSRLHGLMDREVQQFRDDHPKSLALFERARDQMRDAKALFELALVGVDMAALLDPSAPAVGAAIAESRKILEQLRAAPLLARLDGLADGSLRVLAEPEPRARSHAERRIGSPGRAAESAEART